MPVNVFAALTEQWDRAIGAGVTSVVSRAIEANATLLASILTIYVILLGILTSFGKVSWPEFVTWMVRGSAVSMLLAAPAFSQYVQTPLMETIPAWIASTTMGVDVQDVPAAFDRMRAGVLMIEGRIYQQLGMAQIAEMIVTSGTVALIAGELWFVWGMWQLMRGVIAFLVVAAPFLLAFYLFAATRHITLNWAGTAISALLAMMMLGVMVSFTVAVNNAFLESMIARQGTVLEMIDTLRCIVTFFAFSAFMTLFLPLLAMRMGHGVLPNINPMLHSASRWAGRGIGR
ncbi:MAG: type IV secretion system protein [Acetobacteraceae bacterium]